MRACKVLFPNDVGHRIDHFSLGGLFCCYMDQHRSAVRACNVLFPNVVGHRIYHFSLGGLFSHYVDLVIFSRDLYFYQS